MPFEREYSNYPKEKIKLHKYKNIDNDIASIINEINTLRAQGHYDQATELIKSTLNTPNDLSQYIIDATTFRTLEEEIYNTQIYAKQKQQFIYFDKDEPDALYSDVWISDTGVIHKPEPPIKEVIHTYTKTCVLSDGIWEGAILSEENYVHLCNKSTTSSWTYYHNLGIDVDKVTSISGNISSDNNYKLAIETFQTLDNISRIPSTIHYISPLTVSGINDNSIDHYGINNPKLGYVYVDTLFTNTPEYDSEINPACFLKLYVYPDYVKFEFTAENPESRLNIYRMYINMRSVAPVFSFSFTYTD